MATWPSSCAGALLLLFEEQLELLVGDEAEVDEDLSDAALGHGVEAVSGQLSAIGWS